MYNNGILIFNANSPVMQWWMSPTPDPKALTCQCTAKTSTKCFRSFFLKEGRALRTETVICDTHDFGIGRRVCAKNWKALRDVGQSANRRLCDAEAQDAMPAPDVGTFERVTGPSTSEEGLYAPALRFGDSRVMAVLAAVVGFCHLVDGFIRGQRGSAGLRRLVSLRPFTWRQRRSVRPKG